MCIARRKHWICCMILGMMFLLCCCNQPFNRKNSLKIVGFNISTEEEVLISEFKKKFPDIEVEIKDYAQDGDYEAALNRLNADIMRKDVGDILISNSLIPLEQYEEKGLFWDMNEAEEMTELKKTLLPNVIQACEKDGKIYSVFSDFTIEGFAVRRDILSDDKWDVEAVIEMLNKMADEECDVFSTRSKTIYESILTAIVEENERENREITRDNEISSFMEITKKLMDIEKKSTVREPWDLKPYQSGEIPVSWETITGFISYYQLSRVKYCDDEILVKGYPCLDSSPLYDTSLEFSIFQSSEQKESAWKFVSFMLGEEYQTSYYTEEKYAFPVNQKIFNKMYEATLSGLVPDENGEQMVPFDFRYEIKGREVDIGEPKEEDLQPLLDAIASMKTIRKYDKELAKIVSENMEKYYDVNDASPQPFVDEMKYEIGVMLEERK